MKNNQTTGKLIPLAEFLNDETTVERKFIEGEKKYFEVAMSIRKLRRKLGLTQESLAEKSNLPRTTISKIESGSRNATIQTLMVLAHAMGKNIKITLY